MVSKRSSSLRSCVGEIAKNQFIENGFPRWLSGFDELLCGSGEVETRLAALVRRIGAPLNPAARLQTLHDRTEARLSDIENIGKLRLHDSVVPGEVGENPPARAGHPKRLHDLVEGVAPHS